MKDHLYLDHNGSTPLDPEVARVHADCLRETWGNASAPHPQGLRAREAIRAARAGIARSLGAEPGEIWFTSGGTESNNWALLRSARAADGGHLAISAIEHKSVLEPAAFLERQGVAVTRLPVTEAGVVSLRDLEDCLREDTFLVSVMLANNETGVLQPAAEIGALCRARGLPFHCDATAAVGKVPVDVRELSCDLLTLSSHKLYAPKGCGLLYLRAGLDLPPLIHGCGQQEGMRNGTENTPGVVAFAQAFARLKAGAFAGDPPLAELRDALWERIRAAFPDVRRNGSGPVLGNTLSVAFPGRPGFELQAALAREGISVSAGAAAAGSAPSHVLLAMGLGEQRARSTLRFSLGTSTRSETLDAVLEALQRTLRAPR